MMKKTFVWTLLIAGCLTSVATASINCQDNYIAGRTALFEGSLSGLREAYIDFNEAMQSPACDSNSNLIFLHAVTRTAMLFIDDSNLALTDSFIDIANGFGVTIVGDSFSTLKLSVPTNSGCYTIPPGAPDANEIYLKIQNSIIPEINSIVAELSKIKNSNKFQIAFSPSETGLGKTIKVDYGEVLLLKGLLLAMKSQLEFKQAYNLAIDPNDPVMSHVFCDTNSLPHAAINNLLDSYPRLLTVLPDGNSLLVQSKKDLIDAINNYFAAIKNIQSIKAPREDHLIYIDPNVKPEVDLVGKRLTTLRDSLKKGAAGKYPVGTTNRYNVRKGSKVIGNLVLISDVTGITGSEGTLTFNINGIPTPWKIDNFEGTGADFGIDLEYSSLSEQRWGWFQGTLSSDGKKITNGVLEYWGYDSNTVSGLSAQLTKTQTAYGRLDLNPVFGGIKKRYPNPVSPRNLLPEFDSENQSVPGTVWHGLGNDATLGGIFPDMNQQNWSN
jgi:hypothetical protein